MLSTVNVFIFWKVNELLFYFNLGNDDHCSILTRNILQRWAPALFSLFRAREREGKKRARKREEKKPEKKWKRRAQKKKARIRAFSATHSGNPALEPKATRQGESKGLEEDVQYTSVC